MGGVTFQSMFRQQRPCWPCWCNVLGDGGGEAVSVGLVCSEPGSSSPPALCFSLLCRSPNPPPAPPQNANTHTSHSSPVPVFPFVSSSSPRSLIALSGLYRLVFFYSSGAALHFFPSVICFSSPPFFADCLPFLPSCLPPDISASQSVSQSGSRLSHAK